MQNTKIIVFIYSLCLSGCITIYNSDIKPISSKFCIGNEKYHIFLLNSYSQINEDQSIEMKPEIPLKSLKKKLMKVSCIEVIEEISSMNEANHIDSKLCKMIKLNITYHSPFSFAKILFLIPTRSLTEYKVNIINIDSLNNQELISTYRYEKLNYYWFFLLPLTPFLFDDEYEETILNNLVRDLQV
ncbi:hypothetical protein [Leptospira sp. GIMC2001]|uniref:hypothetical protein n=1 Tax=Leptospira sp. GIMC2001 TaxID=1513297 RepID=UPI002349EC32|nr:hypothetical protein [Leptospira sp. GIMC2001]WCL50308.1 hypothetical protein O4O04_05675 [Leptospira sp. GIMC2001]